MLNNRLGNAQGLNYNILNVILHLLAFLLTKLFSYPPKYRSERPLASHIIIIFAGVRHEILIIFVDCIIC